MNHHHRGPYVHHLRYSAPHLPHSYNTPPPIPSPINSHLTPKPVIPIIDLYPSLEYEQRLRDEVIYFHSLWHQGPPRDPTASHLPPQNRFIKACPSTLFNKKRKEPTPDENAVFDKEWPVNSPRPRHPSFETGWPEFKSDSGMIPRVASEEEDARVLAIRVQRKCMYTCAGFFKKNNDDDDEDDDEEDDNDGEAIEDYEEFGFFLNLFEEDDEFRVYYEKNWENGEFLCLVCGASRSKSGRKFKNCVALVQHSTTVAKTKKRRAHRAYGHVICKVLCWEIDRLPSIVYAVGDTHHSLEKSNEEKEEAKSSDRGLTTDRDDRPSTENRQFIAEDISAVDKDDSTPKDEQIPTADPGDNLNTVEACLLQDEAAADGNQEGHP